MKRTYTVLLALVLCACTGSKPHLLPPQRIPLSTHDPDSVKFIHQQGDNVIKASAFLTQQGGGVVTCAGRKGVLVPAATYSNERIRLIFGSEERGYEPIMVQYAGAIMGQNGMLEAQFRPTVIDPPKSYLLDMRESICDARGEFEFENVMPGTYYVIASVIWKVGVNPQGGGLMQRVIIPESTSKKTVKVTLTSN